MDGGLLVLSRYPMVTTKFMEYDASAKVDKIAAKGVLYVQLELGTQNLHLFNTHMQAFYGRHDEEAIIAKTAQTRQLARFIFDTVEQDDDPVVVCGDLNINSKPDPNGDGSELSEYRAMMAEFSRAGADITDIVAQKYRSNPPASVAVTYDENGHEVSFPHVRVDDKTLKKNKWSTWHASTDHILLWRRKPAKSPDSLKISNIEVKQLATETGLRSSKKMKNRHGKDRSASPSASPVRSGSSSGWLGLSQGLSDHCAITCTLWLKTGLCALPVQPSTASSIACFLIGTNLNYTADTPPPPVNGFQSPLPIFWPIIPADIYAVLAVGSIALVFGGFCTGLMALKVLVGFCACLLAAGFMV